jgi:hypothetical protein
VLGSPRQGDAAILVLLNTGWTNGGK